MNHREALRSFADEVGRTQVEWLGGRSVPNVDDQLQAVRKKRAATKRRVRAVVYGVAGSLAVAAALGLLAISSKTLTFSFAGRQGQVGEPIESAARVERLTFSDGSSVVVAPEGRVRIVAIEKRGANVLLERGTIDVNVVHRDDTQWAIAAGPFAVHVTGTAFDAHWDPRTEHLTVRMREGRVVVDGPCVSSMTLRAGESHDWNCPTLTAQAPLPVAPPAGSDAIRNANVPLVDRQPAEPVASGPIASAESQPLLRAVPSASQASTVTSSAAEGDDLPSDWKREATAGHYAAAWQVAVASGQLTKMHPVDELLTLADVARLSRHSSEAASLYRALRNRFPGTSQASVAAFQLGRLVSGGHSGEGRSWFERTLAEQPHGPFAQEALGRLVELDIAAGDRARAADRARLYLSQFPTGPHAAFARSVLAPRTP